MAKCRLGNLLLWLLLILEAGGVSVAAEFSVKELYDANDEVRLLNGTLFDKLVLGSTNAWAIQFFNSWCGHCQAYAPTWKKLADDVKAWRSVITVAAIDCANEATPVICRRYDAYSFPTIKFIPPRATIKDTGKLFVADREDLDKLRQEMINFVTLDTRNPPSSWPDLLTVSYADAKSLWSAVPANLSWVAVVVESPESYLGREIILSTQSLSPYVQVTRAIMGRAPFVDCYKNMTVPFMVVANRTGGVNVFKDSQLDKVREPYVKHLEEIAKTFTKWEAVDYSLGDENDSIKIQPRFSLDYETNTVYAQDLDNAIKRMFWHEVTSSKNVTGEKFQALKSFVAVLAKYFPGSEELKPILNDINAWLNVVTDGFRVEQLEELLDQIKVKYQFNSTLKPWTGCQGSRIYFRGYPCGLWSTFHALTVAAYKQNEHDPGFNSLEVPSAIRGYVVNFFGCRSCAVHFKGMSSQLEAEVAGIRDTVLWLWQAHNKVNKRLKGHTSEDPHHPKRQFPPEELCKSCRRVTDRNAQWNIDNVFNFLLKHYSEGIVRDPSKATTLQPSRPENMKRREIRRNLVRVPEYVNVEDGAAPARAQLSVFAKWGFGKFDMSLCIFLYLASIGLLIACYCYVLTRRRSFPFIFKRNKCNFLV